MIVSASQFPLKKPRQRTSSEKVRIVHPCQLNMHAGLNMVLDKGMRKYYLQLFAMISNMATWDINFTCGESRPRLT